MGGLSTGTAATTSTEAASHRNRTLLAPPGPLGVHSGPASTTSPISKCFLSYARGEQSTLFARWLKQQLEHAGHFVWMDESSIQTGVDWMAAIGEAIEASDTIVCIIDQKFTTSKYCCNELVMAQSCGVALYVTMRTCCADIGRGCLPTVGQRWPIS